MPSDPKKRCRTWHLLDWTRRNRPGRFAEDAQAALDNAECTDMRASGPKTLADLRPGECGTIRLLVSGGQGRLRLMEMGLTPETHIKVTRVAAFGGPLDILVRGYQLSLRREEAAAVWLESDELKELEETEAREREENGNKSPF